MSQKGQNQTWRSGIAMSALAPKTDIQWRARHVRLVPILLQKSVEGFWGQ